MMTDEVWLDTNILWKWNLRLGTPEADKFFKFAEEWDIKILVPEVALSELAQDYTREVLKHSGRAETARRKLQGLEIPISEGQWVTPPADLDSHFQTLLRQRCSERSIEIIPITQVPTDRLLHMSVRRIPPFEGEEGERGLRDTLILFTILERARKKEQIFVYLISQDRVFGKDEIKDLGGEYGVDLFVYQSVDEFIDSIYAELDENYKLMLEERENRVRKFLLEQKPKIEEFIEQNAEFEPEFLAANVPGIVKKVIGISVDDIPTVRVLRPELEEGGIRRLYITFWVRLKMALETESLLLLPPEPKRFRVGLEPATPVYGFGTPRREVITTVRGVICEATARERIEDEALIGLELKEVKTLGSRHTILAEVLGGEPSREDVEPGPS